MMKAAFQDGLGPAVPEGGMTSCTSRRNGTFRMTSGIVQRGDWRRRH